jgi:hypothetical protein
MRAEDQSMLVEEAQGQQTIQALFVQTSDKEQPVILNCQFERDPADGKLYYVFSGTAEHYLGFRTLMEDYAVFPAHEVPGNRHFNAATAENGETERTAEAAPPVADVPDTLSDAPAELSATDGEVVQPEGATDVASVHSPEQPAGSGQSPAGDGREAGGTSAGGDDVHGGGHAGQPGTPSGGPGGEATGANGAGTVSAEVSGNDPFADLEL